MLTTKEKILRVAVKLATHKGYRNITRDQVAEKAGISPALINHYFGTIKKLRKKVIQHAIKNKLYNLIAQGLTLRDPLTSKIPYWLKEHACTHVLDSYKNKHQLA